MLELFDAISLDKNLKTPLYIQLFESIKNMILQGLLTPDSRLPSVRQLSGLLAVNQVTVVSAFNELEKEGYIYKKAGSGTYVSTILPLTGNWDSYGNNIILDELYQQDDLSQINKGQVNINENTINFASATPTPDLFPVEDFKLAINEVLERDKGNAFGYQESKGFLPLRECICQNLKSRDICCSPEDIQVISGAQQGIDIISKAFLRQGDYVITESPTYTGAIAVFRSRGAEIADIQLDEDGLSLSLLEYNLKKYSPKLIYTMPSFQNPTGYSYSYQKKLEILKLADKYGCYIIEDDYVSDISFDRIPRIPLKSLDKNNRVIFIKSFSKIFMPGLRLGFMVVPAKLHKNILEAKHTTDISTSGLIQRAFDLYIRKGFWDNHFNFMYDIYRERYEKLVKLLDTGLPDSVNYLKPGGGLNIWLKMPYGFPVDTLLKHSSANDVVFAPGQIFYSNNSSYNANNLRLSFASVYTDQIEHGVRLLCKLMEAILNKNSPNTIVPIL